MRQSHRKLYLIVPVCLVLAFVGYQMMRSNTVSGGPKPNEHVTNAERVTNLLSEMETMDPNTLSSLPALAIQPLTLPGDGVDIMRVRLEETYEVEGIGKDTVPLTGWIAVKHTNTRPAHGETEIKWGTTITDTEFVGMDLRGESKIFGPVRVSLDKTERCVGAVGKLDLPFAVASSMDSTYLSYRQNGRARDSKKFVSVETPAVQGGVKLTGAKKNVYGELESLMRAISNKDSKTMLKHYSSRADTVFFGSRIAGTAQKGRDSEVESLSKMFANIKSIKVEPNTANLKVSVSGNLAVAALTGTNVVVNSQGAKGSSEWRWTVELERKGERWLITHDHLSFNDNPESPLDAGQIRGAAERAACCLASLRVNISMPQIDLHMATAEPVNWYSEVETIPPVGYTASVSFAPTALMSQGRKVATLTSGLVKFREVVRHVDLDAEE